MAGAHKIVAVCPAPQGTGRGRLFAALEQALPVRFEARRAGELGGADGALIIGAEQDTAQAERAAEASGVPVLIARAAEPVATAGTPGDVALAAGAELDSRLRGQVLRDPAARAGAPLEAEPGDTVLASAEGAPVWLRRGRNDIVAFAPAELDPGEALRARIQDGRALALLALLHWLRELSADVAFRPPPLRASFLIDDPNLHWTSYGHLRYPELAGHAQEHDYHVAMAMVPLDGWLAHPAAARLFRERSDRLSLVFHGNNHLLEELGRSTATPRRHGLLAQALRRVESFEGRTGLRVSRVMTAPHGDCSEAMARDILRLGFEALCIGRPYPWAARPPASWLTGPADASPLAAFQPASVVVGGLPVLLRRPFGYSPGDLALRAFLDQPLIVYGHHDDVGHGLEPFARWAERVNALGDVRWSSLGEIATGNYATRREGHLLRVRLYSRRVSLDVPEGVDRIVAELPGGDGRERVLCPGAAPAPLGEELSLDPGRRRLELALARPDRLDSSTIPTPAWTPWPLARRFAGEGRDRVAPLLRRAGRQSGARS